MLHQVRLSVPLDDAKTGARTLLLAPLLFSPLPSLRLSSCCRRSLGAHRPRLRPASARSSAWTSRRPASSGARLVLGGKGGCLAVAKHGAMTLVPSPRRCPPPARSYSRNQAQQVVFCVCDQPTLLAANSAVQVRARALWQQRGRLAHLTRMQRAGGGRVLLVGAQGEARWRDLATLPCVPQAAYNAVPGMLVGMLLMTVYGVVLLVYLTSMLVRVNMEQVRLLHQPVALAVGTHATLPRHVVLARAAAPRRASRTGWSSRGSWWAARWQSASRLLLRSSSRRGCRSSSSSSREPGSQRRSGPCCGEDGAPASSPVPYHNPCNLAGGDGGAQWKTPHGGRRTHLNARCTAKQKC